MILRSSISFKNSRLHLVCLKCISANGSSVIHFFINAVLMIYFKFFRYFTVAFCAQFFCILMKCSNWVINSQLIDFNGISASLYCSLINSFKYLAYVRIEVQYLRHIPCSLIPDIPNCVSGILQAAFWEQSVLHNRYFL